MAQTVLITGGNGKTGLPLAKIYTTADGPQLLPRVQGKGPEQYKSVKFDWYDPATYENPWTVEANITGLYVVCPPGVNLVPIVKPFIDLAISKGVKRIVHLSSQNSDPETDEILHGPVHKYISETGVGYAVLRPVWFQENFGTLFVKDILENSIVQSAFEDGKEPFISCIDIAQTAFNSFAAEKAPNTDYFLVGPTLYTYDEALELFSQIVGRKITHKRLTAEEEVTRIVNFGLPEPLARAIVNSEVNVAQGFDAALVKHPKTIIGKVGLKEYFEANKYLWAV